MHTGSIVGLRLANERRRYFVTTSLIGWLQAYNQSCAYIDWMTAYGEGFGIDYKTIVYLPL